MANGLNTIMIKRDISSNSNSNNSSNYQQNNNNNYIKIEQSLNNNINTMIKREIIDCNTKINNNNNNNTIKSQQNNKSSSIVSPSAGNTNNTTNNNNNTHNCGNTKMGSRRIFTPQFKLQVLESYRNDNDCKGNQRATARKYGIHRRQIQKWLQCESNLRTSVANLNNQNNNNNNTNNNVIIKHQFHNISHHHQQQHQQQSILTNLNNNNNNQQYNKITTSSTNASNIQLSLDSARHSVALNSIQTLSPPLSTSSTSSATTVASMTATTQSNINSIATTSSACSPISIKTPTQINCKSNNNILLHHNHQQQQQQQQNTMPYLTHTPAINTSVSVPIPIIPTHSAAAAAAAAAYYQHQYHLQIQHHNDIVTSQHNQHNQHQQNDNCMPPSVSLQVIHHQQQHHHYQNDLTAIPTTNQTNELRDYQPIYTATGNPITLSPNYEEFAISRNVQTSQEQSKLNYENLYNDNHDYYQVQPQQQEQQYEEINRTATSSPIDLSLGYKKLRDESSNDPIVKRRLSYNDRKIIRFEDNTKLIISKQEIEINHNEENSTENNDDNVIVDLSCRKRKASINKSDTIPPEKLQKHRDNVTATSSLSNNNDQTNENGQYHNNQQQQPKPVKLFKPYLLDDNNDVSLELKKSEQQDPIIWSHHPSSNYDSQCSSRGSNFHVGSPIEYQFPVGSPIFNQNNQYYQQSHNIASSAAIQSPCSSAADSCCNRSTIVQSPISPVSSPQSPITQTNSQFWCPKGSPVSGYDTASTYSDCSDNYKNPTTTTTKDNVEDYYSQQQRQQNAVKQSSTVSYSFDIKMHTVDNSYYTNNNSSGNLVRSKTDLQQNGLYRNHHVQRWLDHESNADVRHGIAVYV